MSTLTEALRLQIDEVQRLSNEKQGLLRYQVEAHELAEMFREFMRAANSRGRLSPGGCDANTEEGHIYSQALDYFAAHGYPC